MLEAAEQKLAGHELTEPAPEARRGKVIDLMSALKESLRKRGVAINADRGEEAPAISEREQRKVAQGSRRAPRSRRSR